MVPDDDDRSFRGDCEDARDESECGALAHSARNRLLLAER